MTKLCSKCGKQKPKIEFGKDSQKRDGLLSSCKSCRNSAAMKYREKNIENERARVATWYQENKERAKSINAKYRSENKDKEKARKAKWNLLNPDAHRIYKQNRRTLKNQSGGKLSKGLSGRLFKLQRGKCACGCNQPLNDDFHLDHIMPLALGGTNTDDNIQLLRAICNLQKHAKHPVEFMQMRGFLI